MTIRAGNLIILKQMFSVEVKGYVFLENKSEFCYCLSRDTLEIIRIPIHAVKESDVAETDFQVNKVGDIYTLEAEGCFFIGKLSESECNPDQWIRFESRDDLYNARDALLNIIY